MQTIEETILSVLAQDYPSIEYLIIDGVSTDGTIDILSKYKRTNRLKYVTEPDSGIYDAMNKGISAATGDWLMFLGSDDVFFDDNVLKRVFSTNLADESIIYGNVKFLHSGLIYDGVFDQEKISLKNICHQAMLFKKNVFNELGNFNLKYKIYADHEFNLRWMGAKISNKYVSETLVIFNEKGISGGIIDEKFLSDFDQLLINNNIVSSKSFFALKKENMQLRSSYRYKVGNIIMKPFSWLKKSIKQA